MKTVLITGASGFVGRHLAHRLLSARSDRPRPVVHALLRANSDGSALPEGTVIHRYDGNPEQLRAIVTQCAPDVTFHLAALFRAEHQPNDIRPLIDSNLEFSTQLVDAVSATPSRRLVNAGTIWQHFDGDSYNPVCLYAATKQAFEAILAFYAEARGLHATTLLLPDSYGPNDTRNKLITLLLRAAHRGTVLELSPGQQRIDLLHVDDVVSGFIQAADQLMIQAPGSTAGAGQASRYQLSSGQPRSLHELTMLISSIVGKPIDARWGARPYRQREVMMPWQGGAALPGWHPTTDLRTGLEQIKDLYV